jgi:iron complex transport system substrate-binding protein
MMILIAMLLVFSVLAGCSPSNESDQTPTSTSTIAETPDSTGEITEPDSALPQPYPVTVTDMKDRVIALDAPVERVIALTAANAEIVYALGAGDLMVGRGEYCDYPAEVFDVETIGSGANTNIEQIIALDPDVIFMDTMAQTIEQNEQIEQAGIAAVVTEASDISGTYESILLIGTVLGKDAEAQALVDGMKAAFADIAENQVSGTIYFEVSPLEYGLWTAGKGTFMDEVAVSMGLTNVFGDVEGWAEISEEQVLERNPDYIVTVGMYFGDGLRPDEEIYARPAWQGISAVANNGVINIDDNSLARPGPRLADGAKQLHNFVKAAVGE